MRAVIDEYLGPKFLWYVVVGNHEVENAAVMPWVDIYRADPSGRDYKLGRPWRSSDRPVRWTGCGQWHRCPRQGRRTSENN